MPSAGNIPGLPSAVSIERTLPCVRISTQGGYHESTYCTCCHVNGAVRRSTFLSRRSKSAEVAQGSTRRNLDGCLVCQLICDWFKAAVFCLSNCNHVVIC